MTQVATLVAIYAATGQPGAVALGFIAQALGTIIMSGALGGIADRFPRRRLVVTLELVRAGMLVALATDKRTFRLAFEGADHVSGSLSPILSFEVPARVPARYTADLTKRSRVRYSAETDEVTWVLNRLELV